MNKKILIGLTLVILVVSGSSQQVLNPPNPAIRSFAWLSGCWQNINGEKRRDEIWSQPSGNSILGIGHLANKTKTLEFEFMRIHRETDGVYFTAKPSGQTEDSFKLTRFAQKEIIFENPDHDFPQRIIYRQKKSGSLIVRIEGKNNEKELGIDFPFSRVICN